MSSLSLFLPPLASDCAGACAALYDFGLPVLLLGSRCCINACAQCDEPRWEAYRRPVAGAPLHVLDTVFGGADAVARFVEEVRDRFDPPAVVLAGSPVPTMAGFDLDGLALEAEQRTGVPVVAVGTTGFKAYGRGVEKALGALLDRFAGGEGSPRPGCGPGACDAAPCPGGEAPVRVSLVGATPIDCAADDVELLEERLRAAGGAVVARLGMGGALGDPKRAVRAHVSIALSASGVRVARLAERRWGVPWVPGGLAGAEEVDRTVRTALALGGGNASEGGCGGESREAACRPSARVLVVGDQLAAASVRRALEARCPNAAVRVGSLFGLDRALARPGDLAFAGEGAFLAHMAQEPYDLVVGDPLLKQAVELYGNGGSERTGAFAELPHGAVSGWLHGGAPSLAKSLPELLRALEGVCVR